MAESKWGLRRCRAEAPQQRLGRKRRGRWPLRGEAWRADPPHFLDHLDGQISIPQGRLMPGLVPAARPANFCCLTVIL
uniref:Uncharacterized protein n=1 Tax=Arundo donax TaxID=35708 RepID=A0A0A8YCK5_ARUDO